MFGDDGGALRLGTAAGDVSSGYTVTLNVGVDTTTGAGGGGSGGGPGGTPPTGGPTGEDARRAGRTGTLTGPAG